MGVAFLLVSLDKEEWEWKSPKWLLISILIHKQIPHIFGHLILMVDFPNASIIEMEKKEEIRLV